jgi:hypothetical protein
MIEEDVEEGASLSAATTLLEPVEGTSLAMLED